MCSKEIQEIYDLCSRFKNLLDDLPASIKSWREQQSRADMAISDLHHRLEGRVSSKDAMFIGLELAKWVKERRVAKDMVFLLTAINKQLSGKDSTARTLGNMKRLTYHLDILKEAFAE